MLRIEEHMVEVTKRDAARGITIQSRYLAEGAGDYNTALVLTGVSLKEAQEEMIDIGLSIGKASDMGTYYLGKVYELVEEVDDDIVVHDIVCSAMPDEV